ncbi:MAG TPA: tetratricopeptide repeat protein, partial [Sulfuricaulis sp.]|nr:tetratricopeptide repeat protein [Sulfuricaulis sp.]
MRQANVVVSVMMPSRQITLALLLLLSSLLVMAAPPDDMAAGIAAYNRGDVVEAMRRFQVAAEAGHAPAQARLGYILDKAEENEQAVKWYRRAAEQGDADGEHGLGQMYATGEGVKRDMTQALRWITRAAEKNHLPAITALAATYEKGAQEVAPDPERARHWYQRAADLGDKPSIQRLARAHRQGELG